MPEIQFVPNSVVDLAIAILLDQIVLKGTIVSRDIVDQDGRGAGKW